MIITKSISRFARNTLDCLNYVRELKDLGIGIIFEKENINTLDAKGEVLLTILSSLAQDESRSISENCTWEIRRRFETGKHKMSTKRFLGYDTDENGKLVINRTQEPIVIRLYLEFLDGKTTDYIKRIFEREGVKNWDSGTKWQSTTLMSMLENEKYKGDSVLPPIVIQMISTSSCAISPSISTVNCTPSKNAASDCAFITNLFSCLYISIELYPSSELINNLSLVTGTTNNSSGSSTFFSDK